jgi:hypothetical protein
LTEKINNFNILHKTSLLIPDNQTALTGFTVDAWNVAIEVSMEQDADTSKDSGVEVSSEGNLARMKFMNWSHTLGISFKEPIQFATTNTGQIIKVYAANQKIGALNNLILQFHLEDTE